MDVLREIERERKNDNSNRNDKAPRTIFHNCQRLFSPLHKYYHNMNFLGHCHFQFHPETFLFQNVTCPTIMLFDIAFSIHPPFLFPSTSITRRDIFLDLGTYVHNVLSTIQKYACALVSLQTLRFLYHFFVTRYRSFKKKKQNNPDN